MNKLKIIMNPPYNRNLHLKVLDTVIMSFDYDTIVNLSPIGWLQDPTAKYKVNSNFNKFDNIKNKLKNVDVIDKLQATVLFNIAFWTNLGIYHIDNQGGLDCDNYWKVGVDKSVASIISKIGIPVFVEKSIPSIKDAFGKNSDRKYWLKCPRVHGHIGKKDEYDIVSPDFYKCLNVPDKENKVIYFDTEEEAFNLHKTLKSPLYKYLKKVGFYSLSNVCTGIPFLGDYTKPWTNERLYNYFNLTEEEINHIEEEMSKYE